MKSLSTILLSLVFFSCLSRKEKVKCFQNEYEKQIDSYEFNKLETMVTDSIKKWANLKMRDFLQFESEDENWKIDKIVFNESRQRLLGWIWIQDKSKTSKMDYIKMFVGENKNGIWFFYFRYLPEIAVPYDNPYKCIKHKKGDRFTKEQLLKIMLFRYQSQSINKKTCKMNDLLIDRWFDLNPGNLEEGYIKSRKDILE